MDQNPYQSPQSKSSARYQQRTPAVASRFVAFVSTVALSTIAGLAAATLHVLTQDVAEDALVFLFGCFAAVGGGIGLASGFLSSLLVVGRITPSQIILVFVGISVLFATIFWNPNGRPVAVQLIALSAVQPLLCIPLGLLSRRISAT